ncbi:type VII secretion system-associated protein [Lentzea flava]|uniref:SseB protein N-terminal domain-containing protein n=1 Tax=Lentzea flava TaxID=103732 RepID=A0ABQ2VHH2_9PSEU|nr:type VII secretion system-associated protein [Lentzea flava]MCP2205455.1 hypothetical protein [Lentzea flava]GGU86952.1 hypothetical protein GCM10010178_91080 [Lentzea flava]
METVTDQPREDERGQQTWILLMDPGWSPGDENEPPPIEAVVGLWPVNEGEVGKFQANPQYVPMNENSPTDPLDAALRLVLRGSAGADQIQLMLRDSTFDIAMNGDGRPLITKSPDDLPCVVVATGEQHRRRVSSPQWRRIDLDELVVLLADGVDVLINPAGPASVRLTGDFMRETSMLTDEEVADLHARHRESSGMRVVSPDSMASE